MRHWTAAERARQSELIRTWKPWEQSTGAKTAEGKAKSASNAVKHNLRSAEFLAKLRELRSILSECKQQAKEIRRFHLV